MQQPWSPASWRKDAQLDAFQPIPWPDHEELQEVLKWVAGRPPLIYAGEARNLMAELARASRREAFVLQAGDCAETFEGNNADKVKNTFKVILQMALVLIASSGVPVVKIGRIAGQFAKPRSSEHEEIEGASLLTYRGDMVNRTYPSEAARRPNAQNLREAYEQSAQTLNLLRAFAAGGFADLASVHSWNREFITSSAEGQRYETVAYDVDRHLRFMRACGIDAPAMHHVDFYTSHEALILEYEEALTRKDSTFGDAWYDCSAHLLWVGARTLTNRRNQCVELLRGVGNPVALKVHHAMPVEDLLHFCDVLDPSRTPGRLTLISRMGKNRVRDCLPERISAVRDAGHQVLWICDPMHGNTYVTGAGVKTRQFDDILAEIEAYFDVHRELGTWPGGLHVEMTGDNVTECVGGSDNLTEVDLSDDYNTACDPRLNARQSLDLVFRVSELLQDVRTSA